MKNTPECKWFCEDGIVPCDNCSDTEEHTCYLDGDEYGPYECPIHGDMNATKDN